MGPIEGKAYMEQNKRSRVMKERHYWEEWTGRIYTSVCVVFLVAVIVSIVYFVASKGVATFAVNGVSLREFSLEPNGVRMANLSPSARFRLLRVLLQ